MEQEGFREALDLVHSFRAQVLLSSDHLRWRRAFTHESLRQPSFPILPTCPAHGKVTYLQKTCSECLASFSTNSNLEQHASCSGHTAFSCTCGAQFSRAYTLTRHINSMIGPSFPCELCDDKAFPRLDKLGDHLRRWHRLGAKALNQYKCGSTAPGTPSLPNGSIPPAQAEACGQAYPVAPDFDAMSIFNGFPSVTNTPPDASSVESSASPDSSTVS